MYGRRVEQSFLSEAIFFTHLILILSEFSLHYGFPRAQLDTLSREELVEELIKCSNIADQLKILIDRFDDFVASLANMISCNQN